MQKNNRIGVYIKGPGTNTSKGWIPGMPTHIKDMDCDIQPYSTELLLKTYGYSIEVTDRIFCDLDIAVKVGAIIKYKDKWGNDKSYEVRKIIPWDDYMEVMVYELQEQSK